MSDIITDTNDMYAYFELIRQIEPRSILDVGVFLKRIGAIARQVKDMQIDEEVRLDGLGLNSKVPPIYKTIYTNIYDMSGIIEGQNVQIKGSYAKYDVAFAIQLEAYLKNDEIQNIWKWLEKHTEYIVTDVKNEKKWNQISQYKEYQELKVENNQYALIKMSRN